MKSIIEEIGGDVFCLLVDESADVSGKEQMAVVVRYVDKLGGHKGETDWNCSCERDVSFMSEIKH